MWFTIAKTFIVKNWKPLLIIGVFLVGFFYWQGLLWKIDSLEKDVEKKKQEIATLEEKVKVSEANFNGVKGAIDVQNHSLANIDKMLARNAADWKSLVASVQGQNDELSKRLAEIMNEKKPLTCEDAMKYLLDARKGYTK